MKRGEGGRAEGQASGGAPYCEGQVEDLLERDVEIEEDSRHRDLQSIDVPGRAFDKGCED